MEKYRVLLVEDDVENCEILRVYLSRAGVYETTVVHDAKGALQAAKEAVFDVVLLDIVLPGMDGVQLCSALRKTLTCPIIFLSCLSDDETIVHAMRMGGDDYLTKPFSCAVLEAHIEAVLRRTQKREYQKNLQLDIGGMALDMISHTLKRKGRVYHLSPTECGVLQYMVHHPNRVLKFEEIYQNVWMRESFGDYRTVFVHVRNLRRKLEEDPANPRMILTIPHGGYMFVPPESE